MKLSRDCLVERRSYVLPDFNLPGVDHVFPVLSNVQPRTDFLRERLSSPLPRCTGFLRDDRGLENRNNHDSCPEEFEKVAPAKVEPVGSRGSEFIAFRLQGNLEFGLRGHRPAPFATAAGCAFAAF